MAIRISKKQSRNKQKLWYTLEWGKAAYQRKATGVFTYVKCKDNIQRTHNKAALALLETKRSELQLEYQSTGSAYVPHHKFKNNFLDFYREFVTANARPGNRHLKGSFDQLCLFLKKSFVSPADITEDACLQFRHHLLDRFTGKSPADYFGAFKRVLRSATKQGYYRLSPAEDIRSRTNPSKKLKGFLETGEYMKLIETPMSNANVRDAFICCCFTGLRWCDIRGLQWKGVNRDRLTTQIIQKKTGKPVELFLHPVVQQILAQRRAAVTLIKGVDERQPVFLLPTANGANKALKQWSARAAIDKPITWHSARLSFSILLQDARVDTATVALLLGHTSSRFVNETYKRHRPKDLAEHYSKLPSLQWDLTVPVVHRTKS